MRFFFLLLLSVRSAIARARANEGSGGKDGGGLGTERKSERRSREARYVALSFACGGAAHTSVCLEKRERPFSLSSLSLLPSARDWEKERTLSVADLNAQRSFRSSDRSEGNDHVGKLTSIREYYAPP